jgi:type VI protein secretion system component Hcp
MRLARHALLFLIPIGASEPVLAAYDLFLCVDGMVGDATSQPSGVPAGCSRALAESQSVFLDGSLPLARDIRVEKSFDGMSLPLRKALVNQALIDEVRLYVVAGGGGQLPFAYLRLGGARVAAVASAIAPTDVRWSESVSFRPMTLEWNYRSQSATGSWLPWTQICWNLASGSATDGACPPFVP